MTTVLGEPSLPRAMRASVPETLRPGGWLPDTSELELWLRGRKQRLESAVAEPFHEEVHELKDLVDRDPIMRMYFTKMISEVPRMGRFQERHLESVDQMLRLMNGVMTMAPEYDRTALVGCPMCAILLWVMGSPTGFVVFREERVNAILKRILNKWAAFLSSRESLYVLNKSSSGWQCQNAQEDTRIHEYEYDPDAVHWGFESWNAFFTRRFKPGMRPVAAADDNKVIVAPCEGTPYAIRYHVKRCDDFWIKSQPYSLQDMLAHDPTVDEFVDGTVYQAYLSAFNYHRWHSPVAGTIRKAEVLPGTYFSEADPEGEDPAGGTESQGYMAHVAARALFLIEADDPGIGLMCFMPIGMAEISSCHIKSELIPGRHVEKGEELGFFQYGGSTYCLIFRPGVLSDFAPEALPRREHPDAVVPVKTRLAVAS